MSRPEIHEVRLEIVRPGNPHNQLLSPLTPYMALCGEGSPITFHVDLEHHQLLTRLERLRYVTRDGVRVVAIPSRLREAEVSDLGNDVARILGKIETLSTELARAETIRTPGRAQDTVHLRLVVSGAELSLIPFEMAIAPVAYPGEGLEFCLQASLPTVVTREIRRSRPLPITWDRAPKVLVIYAEPEGMKVPAKAHIQAIRAALEPWIRHLPEQERTGNPVEDDAKRLRFVKKRLRLLPNASIESIYETCAAEMFTHVHILAHGDTYEYAGEKRFGVALCSKASPEKREVVSGKRLAKALQAEDTRGCSRSEPLMVTLATCDSGNQMTVLVPGGSIAHDLHVEGIPWLFASQFPLTVNGSVRMAEMLYPRLLRGDDPRQILFELRRQLYQSGQNDHDWASIVAYATLPRDFLSQVDGFRSRQIKEAINVCLDRADSITEVVGAGGSTQTPEREEGIKNAIREVEEWLRTWRCGEPVGNKPEERLRRAGINGMHGSTYKRVALLLAKLGKDDKTVGGYYRKSLEHYRDAMAEAGAIGMKYYWTATQYLSLQAVQDGGADAKTFELARGLAIRDTESNEDAGTKAWAYATLAELELLSTYHTAPAADCADEVKRHCEQIVALMGRRSFHVGSTLRQFKRYRDQWKSDRWQRISEIAAEALVPPGIPEPEFDYPESD